MLMDNGPRSEILCGLWQLGRLSQGAYATFVNGTDWNTDHYGPVLQAKNYEQAAWALQNQGYATDPNYAEKLIALIKQYNLNQYDL